MDYEFEKIAYKVGMREYDPDDCSLKCEGECCSSDYKSSEDCLKEEIKSLKETIIAQAQVITESNKTIKDLYSEIDCCNNELKSYHRKSRDDNQEIYDLEKLVKKLITLIDKDTITTLGLEDYVKEEN